MRKLQLSRETLLPLSEDQQRLAVGGDGLTDGDAGDTNQGLTSIHKWPLTHTCFNCPPAS